MRLPKALFVCIAGFVLFVAAHGRCFGQLTEINMIGDPLACPTTVTWFYKVYWNGLGSAFDYLSVIGNGNCEVSITCGPPAEVDLVHCAPYVSEETGYLHPYGWYFKITAYSYNAQQNQYFCNDPCGGLYGQGFEASCVNFAVDSDYSFQNP
jgi:hypothetical protein